MRTEGDDDLVCEPGIGFAEGVQDHRGLAPPDGTADEYVFVLLDILDLSLEFRPCLAVLLVFFRRNTCAR